MPTAATITTFTVRRFEITPHIARRGIEHGSRLGVYRWGMEGTTALLQWVSPLADARRHHHAFVTLGCALICWRRLKSSL